MNITRAAIVGIGISLTLIQSHAATAETRGCPAPMGLGEGQDLIKTEEDAIAIAKIYAKSLLKPEELKSRPPRVAERTKGLWLVYGFEPGGLGRNVIGIDAKSGCAIAASIQP